MFVYGEMGSSWSTSACETANQVNQTVAPRKIEVRTLGSAAPLTGIGSLSFSLPFLAGTCVGSPAASGELAAEAGWEAAWAAAPPFFRWAGLVWIRACRVSSSDREKRFSQPGKVHWWGFSPVWVRMCRVWCSRR